jgi:hypothetical protein
MIYYHFTSWDLWEGHIYTEGLRPQPLLPHHVQDFGWVYDELRIPKVGTWFWESKPEEEIFRDFWLWSRVQKGVNHGILLRVDVPPIYMLKTLIFRELKRDCNFTHEMIIQDKIKHSDIPFDICLHEVNPYRLTPIMEIEERISNLMGAG